MKATLMKVSGFRAAALGTILASSLVFNPLAHAAEKAVAPVQIPATSEAIWRSIDKETAILDTLIRTGKLEELHHHAFAIRDLVAALPSRSGALPAEKIAQIKASSKYVATLAERLDATGDAKDKAAAASNLLKLKGVLKTIRAN
ncbi:hypothetical protein TPL01_21630 [Sulfuriferula plumbiphila]|uniref:Uncharacterized protein n=1 Tax=Sulfuriferula plumbiphila TaxID=171865 RepID=A0A512L950_9PROT|nr:transporter [Sulfuriferula plumbiphila]BBP03054.1 hypothetical protein SFPGR_04760 [Sulfuriferula plumbiphila]GEP31025.1 hypothetical protein TPL01_21630 [Sulfuriferula plumbiphila]